MTPGTRPAVSIIVACYNERRTIRACLDSILAGDYPHGLLDIVIVDGDSTDGTRDIINGYAARHSFVRVLDNPARLQTVGTNIGARAARGEYVVRMDAHAEYPRDYVSTLVEWIQRERVDGVGGSWDTLPGDAGVVPWAISAVLAHPLGVGNAVYRLQTDTAAQLVDTVPYGCYRREEFLRLGGFNEALDRTDDIEFNRRLVRAGGRLLLLPWLRTRYYARSTWRALARQNAGNGYWVVYTWLFSRTACRPRHLVPLACVVAALMLAAAGLAWKPAWLLAAVTAALYASVVGVVALRSAWRRGPKAILAVGATFLVLHGSYAAGSLAGLVRLGQGLLFGTPARAPYPHRLSLGRRAAKRALDMVLAGTGLVATGWIIALAWLVATVECRENGWFVQTRVGQWKRHFRIFKIRTMVRHHSHTGTSTSAHDPRVTRVGRWMRRTKIDELPQLLNVLLGDMSIVGPRPDVPEVMETVAGDDSFWQVRPGLTGPATLEFFDEENRLSGVPDPDAYSQSEILPIKVALNRHYVEHYTVMLDARLILRTASRLVGRLMHPGPRTRENRAAAGRLAGATKTSAARHAGPLDRHAEDPCELS